MPEYTNSLAVELETGEREEEVKYAVQFFEPKFFGYSEITVDTNPISFNEAMELYRECRERFVKAFNNKQDAQLVVWEDVGNGKFPVYANELVELDTRDDLRLINGKFYKTKLVKIEEPDDL